MASISPANSSAFATSPTPRGGAMGHSGAECVIAPPILGHSNFIFDSSFPSTPFGCSGREPVERELRISSFNPRSHLLATPFPRRYNPRFSTSGNGPGIEDSVFLALIRG
jgi:hypothetical protein